MQSRHEEWKKSSYSQVTGSCVEVAGLPGNVIGVRDSKNPCVQDLRFSIAEWETFVTGIRGGKSDPVSRIPSPYVQDAGCKRSRGHVLRFAAVRRHVS